MITFVNGFLHEFFDGEPRRLLAIGIFSFGCFSIKGCGVVWFRSSGNGSGRRIIFDYRRYANMYARITRTRACISVTEPNFNHIFALSFLFTRLFLNDVWRFLLLLIRVHQNEATLLFLYRSLSLAYLMLTSLLTNKFFDWNGVSPLAYAASTTELYSFLGFLNLNLAAVPCIWSRSWCLGCRSSVLRRFD